MPDMPLFILAALSALVVLAILLTGIGGFARGGEFNRRHGNRMMRWRIYAQAIALLLVVIYIWLRGS